MYYTDSTATRHTLSTSGSSFTGITSISDATGNIALSPQSSTGSVTINSSTPATTATSGALIITGGEGVSGAIYAGTSINAGTTATVGTNLTVPQIYGSSSASGNILIDGTSNLTKGNVLLASAGGNVGIGTTPTATLDVAGQLRSLPYNAGSSMAINLNNGNNQYTAPSGNVCGAITLTNMLNGGSYTIAVQGVTSGTCTFTASGLTFVYSPANSSVATDAVYTFLVMGTKVYVSWVTGFQ